MEIRLSKIILPNYWNLLEDGIGPELKHSRKMFLRGGRFSGKSFFAAHHIILSLLALAAVHKEGEPWASCLALRKYSNTLKTSVYAEIANAIINLGVEEESIFREEHRYEVRPLYADSAFFKTLGIKVLVGDPDLLGMSDQIFLSRSVARRIFGEGKAVGEVLFSDKQHSYSYKVAGIFEDFPANSHLKFDMVYSIELYGDPDWNQGDGFTGYVRLQPGADVERINDELLPAMIARHADVESWRKRGHMVTPYLNPVTELHTGDPETRQTLAVLSILAVLILVAVSLNYVMLSISSLASRARTMGPATNCGKKET